MTVHRGRLSTAIAAGAAAAVLLGGCGSESGSSSETAKGTPGRTGTGSTDSGGSGGSADPGSAGAKIGNRPLQGRDLSTISQELGCQQSQIRPANGRAKPYSTQALQCTAGNGQYLVAITRRPGDPIRLARMLKSQTGAKVLPYLHGSNWLMVAAMNGDQGFSQELLTSARQRLGGTLGNA